MLSPQTVADFLEQNPGFFEQHADLLTRLHLPHPHGGRTVSIAERQLIALRDRVRALEGQVAQLLGFGRDNDALGDKVHALACALLASPRQPGAIVEAACALLREQFAVPHVAARLWPALQGEPEVGDAPQDLRDAVDSLAEPCCGDDPSPASREWLGPSEETLQSFAVVPLRADGPAAGVLLLASPDPQRFAAGQGVQHLVRIGALLGHALAGAGGHRA